MLSYLEIIGDGLALISKYIDVIINIYYNIRISSRWTIISIYLVTLAIIGSFLFVSSVFDYWIILIINKLPSIDCHVLTAIKIIILCALSIIIAIILIFICYEMPLNSRIKILTRLYGKGESLLSLKEERMYKEMDKWTKLVSSLIPTEYEGRFNYPFPLHTRHAYNIHQTRLSILRDEVIKSLIAKKTKCN